MVDSLPFHQLYIQEFPVTLETIRDCAYKLDDSNIVLINFTSPIGMKGRSLKIDGIGLIRDIPIFILSVN